MADIFLTTTYIWKYKYYKIVQYWACLINRLVLACNELRHFQQYFSYIVEVGFIGGGNRRTQRKPPICLINMECTGKPVLVTTSIKQ